MDFLQDQLATGQKIRVLSVVDTFSRFSPVLDARISYRGEDVVQTLERACAQVGCPKTIRVDQGTEFVSRDLDLWAYARGVTLDFSRPGKPTDNAFAEAFNSRIRAECLNAHWFMALANAREKLEAWRRYYNEERPHGAIGNKVPIRLQNHDGVAQPVLVNKPGNSNLRCSKEWVRTKQPGVSHSGWSSVGARFMLGRTLLLTGGKLGRRSIGGT